MTGSVTCPPSGPKAAPARPRRSSSDERKEELSKLIAELHAGLQMVSKQRPEDADRIAKTAELVVDEVTKAKPDKTFLSLSVEGLQQAAKAVADIAPLVLSTAAKVATFVAGLG